MDQPRISVETAAEVENLFRAEASSLYRKALVRAQGDRSTAEDLVQQVFQDVALAWHRLRTRDGQAIRRWLCIVLRNKAVSMWRDQQHLVLDPDLLDSELASKIDYSDQAADRGEPGL